MKIYFFFQKKRGKNANRILIRRITAVLLKSVAPHSDQPTRAHFLTLKTQTTFINLSYLNFNFICETLHLEYYIRNY